MKYLIVALMFVLPAAAQGEWLEATSENFVIYANDDEANFRRFAEQLERYRAAMEKVTGTDLPAPSASNRVTIYAVNGRSELRRIYGSGGQNVGGFYIPRAGASAAFVSRPETASGTVDSSMLAVLHEYAHHFLRQISEIPMPIWFDEGAAEFFATAEFMPNGGIEIGKPAVHRAGELLLLRDVKAEQLIAPGPDFYRQGIARGFESFYGKSWLLFHYLIFEPSRTGQLSKYSVLLSSGKPSSEAAAEAFGNLTELEKDLDAYMRRPRMSSMTFAPDELATGKVEIRALSAAEAEILPVHIRLRRLVTSEQAVDLARQARRVATEFPDDPMVLSTIAEAENFAGNYAAASDAAEAAIARDPAHVNGYMQKGYALFQLAARAADRDAAYQAAIEPFLSLNKIENDHPQPLIFYYRSFVDRGVQPPEDAVRGLERAAELAPFDLSLRMNLAVHYVRAGQLGPARTHLAAVAQSPHGGPMPEAARRAVERMDAGGAPQPGELLALLAPPSSAARNR